MIAKDEKIEKNQDKLNAMFHELTKDDSDIGDLRMNSKTIDSAINTFDYSNGFGEEDENSMTFPETK
jgi:hypothetical protein